MCIFEKWAKRGTGLSFHTMRNTRSLEQRHLRVSTGTATGTLGRDGEKGREREMGEGEKGGGD